MDYERWKYFRQATNGVGLTATISNKYYLFNNYIIGAIKVASTSSSVYRSIQVRYRMHNFMRKIVPRLLADTFRK